MTGELKIARYGSPGEQDTATGRVARGRHLPRSTARRAYRATSAQRWLLLALLLPGTCFPMRPSVGQSRCATAFGSCFIPQGLPLGYPCTCYGPGGRPDPGQVVWGGSGGSVALYGNACRTFRGVCQTSPAPIGSACACFGDPGVVQ